MREVTLSYTFQGKGFRDATPFQSIIIAATGRNILNINNIDGIDPETNSTVIIHTIGEDATVA